MKDALKRLGIALDHLLLVPPELAHRLADDARRLEHSGGGHERMVLRARG